MRIVNGNVFTDGEFKHCDITITGERILSIDGFGSLGQCAALDPVIIEADGCSVISGTIDEHFPECLGNNIGVACREDAERRSITPGKMADVVILDRAMGIVHAVFHGELIH